tara:strand:- start:502 stop:615 length:114 start_codon:yes stop_codon:yes gene_type:complete
MAKKQKSWKDRKKFLNDKKSKKRFRKIKKTRQRQKFG